MQIGFVTRKNAQEKWAGDLVAIRSFYTGLKQLGHDVVLGRTVDEVASADFIFLSSTGDALTSGYAAVRARDKRFGVIGFHLDRIKCYHAAYGLAHFVGLCLAQDEASSFHRIEQLLDNPDIVQVFSYALPPIFEENHPILAQAEVCIATSVMEADVMKRDNPDCKTQVITLACEIPESLIVNKNSAFLEWTGLKAGEYVLQVGRFEHRKNQLGSILAMRNLTQPLVFIATASMFASYEQMCVRAIAKYRRAPTFIISQNLAHAKEGNLRVLPMPDGKKLSLEMLVSAYCNAALHLHPAFGEMPGLTYLEAAKCGVPTVASEWTAIKEYFNDPVAHSSIVRDHVVYAIPHHINAIEQCIEQQIKKKHARLDHPIFRRTSIDMAQELLNVLS